MFVLVAQSTTTLGGRSLRFGKAKQLKINMKLFTDRLKRADGCMALILEKTAKLS
jgi:hypothetical protein